MQEDDIRRHHKELRELIEQRKISSQEHLLSAKETYEQLTQEAVTKMQEDHEKLMA
jgi:hypothetical protein